MKTMQEITDTEISSWKNHLQQCIELTGIPHGIFENFLGSDEEQSLSATLTDAYSRPVTVTFSRVKHGVIAGIPSGGWSVSETLNTANLSRAAHMVTVAHVLANEYRSGAWGMIQGMPSLATVHCPEYLNRIIETVLQTILKFNDINDVWPVFECLGGKFLNKKMEITAGHQSAGSGRNNGLRQFMNPDYVINDLLLFSIQNILDRYNIISESPCVGFIGNTNQVIHLAQKFYVHGWKVVVMTDDDACLYAAQGLDLRKLVEYIHAGNEFQEFDGADLLDPVEIPDLPIDVLVLADQGILHSGHIKQGRHDAAIVHLSPGTECFPDRIDDLSEKIIDIPFYMTYIHRIIVNRYTQNFHGDHENIVTGKLYKKIKQEISQIHDRIHHIVHSKKVSLGTAATILALERLYDQVFLSRCR